MEVFFMVFCEQLELPEGSLTRRRGRREYAGEALPNDDERPRFAQTDGQSSPHHLKIIPNSQSLTNI